LLPADPFIEVISSHPSCAEEPIILSGLTLFLIYVLHGVVRLWLSRRLSPPPPFMISLRLKMRPLGFLSLPPFSFSFLGSFIVRPPPATFVLFQAAFFFDRPEKSYTLDSSPPFAIADYRPFVISHSFRSDRKQRFPSLSDGCFLHSSGSS